MPFTAGYKVNANTQFEFTVSDETLQEVVQGGGITESDIADYCYTALIDSRVAKVVPEMHTTSFEPGWEGTVASDYYAYMAGGPALTTVKPTFNKDLLGSTDTAYQRNFLVWEGTIYPGTENEKTGTFLVMDVVNLHNFYVDFSNAGFTTTTVTSSVSMDPLPAGYTWPGYSGTAYEYISNTYAHAAIMTNNNDPQLNPDHNLSVVNVMVINDQLAVAELNPSSHGSSYLGTEDIRYAGFSDEWLNRGGGYLNPGDPQKHYQGVTGNWGAIGNYSSAPDYPGCPSDAAGSLGYSSYVQLSNDDMLLNVFGQWGQQNANNTLGIEFGRLTTSKSTILKWQSWCGLLFKYEDIYYKPIIQSGVVVGYTDDMSKPSEYDDMTNVTGNNISPNPPDKPVIPDDETWSAIRLGDASGANGSPFIKVYYCTSTELTNLRQWMGGTTGEGQWEIPENFDPMASIISCMQLPVHLSAPTSTTIQFINAGAKVETVRVVDTGVTAQSGPGTPIYFNLGTVSIPTHWGQNKEPYLDYSTTIELFIPFCGTFELDTQAVMGRDITCKMVLDPLTGNCFGYAYVYDKYGTGVSSDKVMPVAYGDGNMGVTIPVSAQQYGLMKAAVSSAKTTRNNSWINGGAQLLGLLSGNAIEAGIISQYPKSMRTAAGGSTLAQRRQGAVMFGNAVPSSGSALTAGSSYKTTYGQIQGTNWTAISGSFGGSYAAWAQPYQAYVKITRNNVYKTANYAHACGNEAAESGKLRTFSGYTRCINPDVTNIPCTAGERSSIITALTNGVIV